MVLIKWAGRYIGHSFRILSGVWEGFFISPGGPSLVVVTFDINNLQDSLFFQPVKKSKNRKLENTKLKLRSSQTSSSLASPSSVRLRALRCRISFPEGLQSAAICILFALPERGSVKCKCPCQRKSCLQQAGTTQYGSLTTCVMLLHITAHAAVMETN